MCVCVFVLVDVMFVFVFVYFWMCGVAGLQAEGRATLTVIVLQIR